MKTRLNTFSSQKLNKGKVKNNLFNETRTKVLGMSGSDTVSAETYYRLLEDSDTRILEDGDTRVLE